MANARRLARVHRLRTAFRQQAQDEVAALRGTLAALAHESAQVRAGQDDVRRIEQETAAAGVDGAALARLRAYEAALRTREERLAAERAAVEQNLAVTRERMLLRRREERQVERLRERARLEDNAVEDRAAAVALDDLVRRR